MVIMCTREFNEYVWSGCIEEYEKAKQKNPEFFEVEVTN